MKRIVVLSLFLSILSGLSAQEKPDYYAEHRQKWLDLAEKNKPELVWSVWKPQAIVSISKDTTSFQDLAVQHYEGFEIIRNDGTLEPVSNVSVGRTGRTLRLEVSDMNTVRSVQYAYHNYCRANMENIYGLPMFPFRRVLLERPVNEK